MSDMDRNDRWRLPLIEAPAGFVREVDDRIAELEALRDEGRAQARGQGVMMALCGLLWLAVTLGGVFRVTGWLPQAGEVAVTFLAALELPRWAPTAILATATALALAGIGLRAPRRLATGR